MHFNFSGGKLLSKNKLVTIKFQEIQNDYLEYTF